METLSESSERGRSTHGWCGGWWFPSLLCWPSTWQWQFPLSQEAISCAPVHVQSSTVVQVVVWRFLNMIRKKVIYNVYRFGIYNSLQCIKRVSRHTSINRGHVILASIICYISTCQSLYYMKFKQIKLESTIHPNFELNSHMIDRNFLFLLRLTWNICI